MQHQSLCLGTGLLAVISIVASGCSGEKKTAGQDAPKRDQRSSIVQAPKINRSAVEQIGSAQAAAVAEVQPKTSGNAASPTGENDDDPDLPVTESTSHVSPDNVPNGNRSPKENPRPNENRAAKLRAKQDSSQFDELISVPYMPVISLTSAQQASCRVGQGDTFPPLMLSDLAGSQQPLEKFFGKKLTVVVCSHPGDPYAIEQLDDLEPLVTARFGKLGVEVVAISVRGTAGRSEDLIAQLSLNFPMLLDPKGDAWGNLASESAGPSPRTFLLDAKGRILWFDIEYSRSTRRDLVLAIRHHLR